MVPVPLAFRLQNADFCVIPSVARDLGERGRDDRASSPLPPRSLATLGMTPSTHRRENVLRHPLCQLLLPHEHRACVLFAQELGLVVAVGADDDGDWWVEHFGRL